MKLTLPLGVMATLLLCLPSCLFGTTSKTTYEGRYITEEKVSQVDVGVAEAEVEALLGTPTSKSDLGEGKALWTWRYTRRQKESRHVFLLLASESEETIEGTVCVRLEKGRVEKVWRTQT